MNKLLLIPLMFMSLLAILGMMSNVAEYHEIGGTQGDDGSMTYNGTEYSSDLAYIVFGDLSDPASILKILLIAIAAVCIASITVFGSGVNQTAIRIIFLATLYGSIWALLTLYASDFFSDADLATVAPFLWIGLTITYVIGFAGEATYGED